MAKSNPAEAAPTAPEAAIIEPSNGGNIATKPGVVEHITSPLSGYSGGHKLIVKTH